MSTERNTKKSRRTGLRAIAAALLLAVAAAAGWWWRSQPPPPPDWLVSGNGRIEATEIDVATRNSGRVREVLVQEGDFVEAGQVLARMDTQALEAELAAAQAQLRRAESAKATARSVIAQRESGIEQADALLAQRRSELALAERSLQRSRELVERGFLSPSRLDADNAAVQGARAGVAAAQAQLQEARAAVSVARMQGIESDSTIEAAAAAVARLRTEIADAELEAPRGGRVQYRLAQPGEVLAGGGKVLSLIDLDDVYMTIFVPEVLAGRVAIGSPARIVLDTAPGFPIPASVNFVASEAQFTPKTVETQAERQKLMFRVKVRIDRELLRKYRTQVKTGLPGVAWVRLGNVDEPWPDFLRNPALDGER
ncbi:HlyD family efflux transporter periplasmic adaptor subunit [Burkholderiaceae bacterium FT117]|uniref:HlyD family secretion protein n=1 Tax=Zeimonas sediminis TaxID=2944268 RepID=UPI002342FDB4|nr:HlyD family efflux transporter periplasmic adaptor subunit [Zeimonas sediminis]MCM5570165.1 HlyD family efflux transporter periplasmic adaptor subunit [Zeimonas sediminis]